MEQKLKADVHIRLDKREGQEDCQIEVRAEEAWMLLQGLALLTIKCAQHLGYGADEMIARLATVLLAPVDKDGGT
ncbi:MAG: hypothetical protein IKT52_00375 [Oscillospiraceae bacterium]|nr:hypothetical protein [Oscillospiraceae bacterium]